ncbi:MAG: hypothetical protein QF819_09810 [Gemmatimonadota bacterium]|jgi:hypothetical protein|nr:hypothetical protein [Gemmatimonadota bacterium]MDP6529218.1 hypothetical protein [Gemmatimonadota bacterium]MDP6803447.1 hypothetical protein [Gemmatimonadota bacterium]MDP7031452.1 hypothetical protein [Gemmatimonadota bacterium]
MIEAPSEAPALSVAARSARKLWGGAVLVGAALLLVVSGRGALPSLPSGEEIGIPELISPEGDLAGPPTHFTWVPGGEDVDFAQVIVYRGTMERIWATGPLQGSEATVPEFIYDELTLDEPCAWRVREVVDGRPRASSRLAKFGFGMESDPAAPE